MKKIVLVDMDGVIADFERGFIQKWKKMYPDRLIVPFESRKSLKLVDDYPKEFQEEIDQICTTPNFFLDLPEVPGAIEALSKMQEMGLEVFICTAPLKKFEHCILEKYLWVQTHLGEDWVSKLILTRDKSLIRGDILIDDWPRREGLMTPSWDFYLFDAPYNKSDDKFKRIDWSNWREIFGK